MGCKPAAEVVLEDLHLRMVALGSPGSMWPGLGPPMGTEARLWPRVTSSAAGCTGGGGGTLLLLRLAALDCHSALPSKQPFWLLQQGTACYCTSESNMEGMHEKQSALSLLHIH